MVVLNGTHCNDKRINTTHFPHWIHDWNMVLIFCKGFPYFSGATLIKVGPFIQVEDKEMGLQWPIHTRLKNLSSCFRPVLWKILYSSHFCCLWISCPLFMYHLCYPCWPCHWLYLCDSFLQGPPFVYILGSPVRMYFFEGWRLLRP